MSDSDGPRITGNFSGNVNSNNFIIGGAGANAFWHPMMGNSFFADMMKEHTENVDAAKAKQNHEAESNVPTLTQPQVSSGIQNGKLNANNAPGNSFFPGGPIFGEPRDKTPEPATEEMESYGAPVKEPPAWKLQYKIGSGSFGTVFLEKVQTRTMAHAELWAVKRISRTIPNFPAKRYKDEIKNFQALSAYPWFVKFNISYEDAHNVYIAMEYIPIGDMTKTFDKGYKWKESDAKVVIEQLLQGLVVMHKEGITHRDLKPENIFLCLPDGEGRTLRVKIGDFGTSKRIPISNSSTYLKTATGTESYMAPEMDDTSKPKTNRVDIWSLGCVLYRMVAGRNLFSGRNEVFRYSIREASPPQVIEKLGLSVAGLNFLHDVLRADQKDRPSAEVCLKMAWITNMSPESMYSISRDLYNRLAKIKNEAPDIDSFIYTSRSQVVNPSSPERGFPSSPAPMSNSVGGTPETTKTSDTTSTMTSRLATD